MQQEHFNIRTFVNLFYLLSYLLSYLAQFLAVGVGEGGACRWWAVSGAEELCDELELVSVAPGRCRDFVSRASGSNVIPTQQSDLLLRAFAKQPLQTCYP